MFMTAAKKTFPILFRLKNSVKWISLWQNDSKPSQSISNQSQNKSSWRKVSILVAKFPSKRKKSRRKTTHNLRKKNTESVLKSSRSRITVEKRLVEAIYPGRISSWFVFYISFVKHWERKMILSDFEVVLTLSMLFHQGPRVGKIESSLFEMTWKNGNQCFTLAHDKSPIHNLFHSILSSDQFLQHSKILVGSVHVFVKRRCTVPVKNSKILKFVLEIVCWEGSNDQM